MKRVALITGVAGGIGRATAQLFASEGWYVFGIDLKSEQDLSDIDSYMAADVSDPEQVRNIIAKVAQTTDRLDTVIDNAAIQICKPVVDMDVTEWDRTMAVNLRSTFLFSQSAYPLLKRSQGNIVNVSSVHAIATSANIAAYAASKGGLVALTRALAIEFAQDDIRVNAVLPGAVDTSMLDAGLSRGHVAGENLQTRKQELAQKTVMGKIGKPQEIAQAILFLADNQKSSFMTGQILTVDGGATARLSTE